MPLWPFAGDSLLACMCRLLKPLGLEALGPDVSRRSYALAICASNGRKKGVVSPAPALNGVAIPTMSFLRSAAIWVA